MPPVYAQLSECSWSSWIQVVLQCRVRPGSFAIHPSSLGRHWPADLRFDPNFSSLDGLEWLIESPRDAVVVGLLVREFGLHADASMYGDAAARVTHGQNGPEYEWTRLRAEHFRANGLFLGDSF